VPEQHDQRAESSIYKLSVPSGAHTTCNLYLLDILYPRHGRRLENMHTRHARCISASKRQQAAATRLRTRRLTLPWLFHSTEPADSSAQTQCAKFRPDNHPPYKPVDSYEDS
jgi:hypothetical protein